MPDSERKKEKYEGGILSPIARWLVDQRVNHSDSSLYTMQIKAHQQNSYVLETLSITGETVTNSVLDFAYGYVDLMNAGEGVRLFVDDQASWGEAFKGGGRDVLRALGIIPGVGALANRVKKFRPVARFLQPSQNTGRLQQVVSKVEQKVRDLHQGIASRIPDHNPSYVIGGCVQNALQKSLIQTGRYIFVPFKAICKRFNRHFPEGTISNVRPLKSFLDEIGVSSRLLNNVTHKNVKQILENQGGNGVILLSFMYEFKNPRNLDRIEIGSHMVYAFLDKGKLKFMDRGGVADDFVKLLKDSYGMTKGFLLEGKIDFRPQALFIPNSKVIPSLARGSMPHLLTMLAIGSKEVMLDTGVFDRSYQSHLKGALTYTPEQYQQFQQYPGRIPNSVRCY